MCRQLTGLDFDVPTEFVCPITQNKMAEPVVAADGISYERKAISKWLAGSNLSPSFGTALPSKTLTDNINLRKRIQVEAPPPLTPTYPPIAPPNLNDLPKK